MEDDVTISSDEKLLAIMEQLCSQLQHNTEQLRSQMDQMRTFWALTDKDKYKGKWRSGRSCLGLYYGNEAKIEKWIKRSLTFRPDQNRDGEDQAKVKSVQSESFSDELPKFSGDDVHGWIFKAEQFFQRYGIEDDEKVLISSLHLDGLALSWYKWMSFVGFLKTWSQFVEELKLRFALDGDSGSQDKISNSKTALEVEHEVDMPSEQIVQPVATTGGDEFACLETVSEPNLLVSKGGDEQLRLRFGLVEDSLCQDLSNCSVLLVGSISNGCSGHVLEVKKQGDASKQESTRLDVDVDEFESNVASHSEGREGKLGLVPSDFVILRDVYFEGTDQQCSFDQFGEFVLPIVNETVSGSADLSPVIHVSIGFTERQWQVKKKVYEIQDFAVVRETNEPNAVVFCYGMDNQKDLIDVFDPGGGILGINNAVSEAEAFKADMFLGIELSNEKFASQSFWGFFETMVPHLIEKDPEHGQNSFKDVGEKIQEAAAILLFEGTSFISLMFVDYRELLSWTFDLEDKVNLKGGAFVTNKSLRSNMKNF